MSVQLNFGASYNGNNWVKTQPTSTQYAASSTTIFTSADGYNAGDLDSIAVSPDGVITGNYTNGSVVELFQVATAKFQNPNGLEQLGRNLFAETRNSGNAITGSPGSGGLGNIVPNALEMSNVDLVEEFTKLILFKRSFQANLKVIAVDNELKGDVLDIVS
jgi:flagellar hook-basal body protein